MLKCDVEKYFPSIDHAVLLDLIRKRIWDEDVMWLVRMILDGSNPQPVVTHYFSGDDLFTPYDRRQGIPIGNQTSQFFANVYLDGLDHYVKETMRMPGYVRYVDDLLVFHNEKPALHEMLTSITSYFEDLRLRLHPRKCFVTPVSCGFTFLGYRLFPTHRRVDAANVRRFKRRLRRYRVAVQTGQMAFGKACDCVRNWIAHAEHADTAVLRRKILMDEHEGQPFLSDVVRWRG